MNTTVWVDAATRDRLKARKERTHAPSLDAVIRSLLEATEPTLIDLFQDRQKKIRRVCREHGVARLIAFGSRARDDARAESDLDLAYELTPKRLETFDLFDHVALQDALSEAFGMPVDIVRLAAAPDWLKEEIRTDGVSLVGQA